MRISQEIDKILRVRNIREAFIISTEDILEGYNEISGYRAYQNKTLPAFVHLSGAESRAVQLFMGAKRWLDSMNDYTSVAA
jgi:hypothetical protein